MLRELTSAECVFVTGGYDEGDGGEDLGGGAADGFGNGQYQEAGKQLSPLEQRCKDINTIAQTATNVAKAVGALAGAATLVAQCTMNMFGSADGNGAQVADSGRDAADGGGGNG